jgi:alpha-1,2-mannosyltransferase
LNGAVHGALDKVTRPPVLSVFAILFAFLTALLGLSYVASLNGPVSEKNEVVPGDYMAFATGATLLAEGRGRDLYDLDAQYATQAKLAGMPLGDWQPYVNPPLLAIVLRPFAGLPYVQGFWIYAAAMTIAGILGSLALAGIVSALSRSTLGAVTVGLLALAFHPIARTMFGGQNTVLTWALVTGSLWALVRGRAVLAGVLVGLLSYKPQYVPFLVLALCLARAWTSVAVAAAVALLHYAVAALVLSPDWPLRMLAAMRAYRPMEWHDNVRTHFSLVPFFDHAVGGVAGRVLAALGAIGVAAALFVSLRRDRNRDPRLAWSLCLVAGMLLSPHLQYYDFGVLVLPVAVGLDLLARRGTPATLPLRLVVAVLYVGYPWFYMAADRVGFQPLTVWTVAIFAWLCSLSRRE